jgi:hypothetical protein
LDVKLIRKILRYFPERFKIKVTTIEESKDLKEMKIEELVGFLQTYELSLPPVKKMKTVVQIIILASARIVLQYSVMQVRGRSHRELCCEN